MRRPKAVILDIVWKLIWLLFTAMSIAALVAWIYWEAGSIEIRGPISGLQNPVALAIVAREGWTQYGSILILGLFVLIAFWSAAWILLESYFRAGSLAEAEAPFRISARKHFATFVASTVLKQWMLGSACLLLAILVFGPYLRTPVSEWRGLWIESGSSFTAAAAGLVFAMVWFALTIFETAVRIGAWDALGRELFLIAGVIGVLVLFEGMLLAGAAGIAMILMTFVSNAPSFLVFAAEAAAGAAALTVIHSYFVVVRYNALAVVSAHLPGG